MATSDDVKLISAWPGPLVMRVRIALNIKSVDYEFLPEQFSVKSDLLLKSNSVHKKIPVLIHGDKTLCESLVIVQHVDEVWASDPPILPSDPYDRAIAQSWAAYIDDKVLGSAPSPYVNRVQIALNLKSVDYEFLEEKFGSKMVADNSGPSKCSGRRGKSGSTRARVMEGIVPLEDAFTIGYLDIAFGSFLGWVRGIENITNVKLLDEKKTLDYSNGPRGLIQMLL
ncbi:hypothetical protein Vadar_016961 [Vaccinium darrowii]|uniref:Uncharacterized protein n=1 Tax=Vaccinium darrowii TaxID=229202 RepID=A0ACB7X1A5_9ERIC|nr:hypothetical protein Vadar_016961 [Vaccinium darrowii]